MVGEYRCVATNEGTRPMDKRCIPRLNRIYGSPLYVHEVLRGCGYGIWAEGAKIVKRIDVDGKEGAISCGSLPYLR